MVKMTWFTLSGIVFAVSTTLVVASHTLSALSNGVSGILNALSVSTVLSDVRTKNRKLKGDIGTLKRKVSTLGVRNKAFIKKERKIAALVSKVTKKIKTRTVAVATANVASMPFEVAPFIGAAAVIASTTYEIKEACNTINDMRELDVAFNLEHDIEDNNVCGMEVPTKAKIMESVSEKWERGVEELKREFDLYKQKL